jgi:SAM-dependent methyltransferase
VSETSTAVWPKPPVVLTAEQEKIRDEWMKIWLTQVQSKGLMSLLVEEFNHRYPLRSAKAGQRTLEIGAGVGAHAGYEKLATQEYHCVELRQELADEIRKRHPLTHTSTGDCQQRLDFPDAHFDRVIAIHVLEHLPDLPRALDEVRRLLKPGGLFSVVIPAEGGLGYQLARKVSSQRLFEKRFNTSYDWYIKSEHCNTAREVLDELEKKFVVDHQLYYPAIVPSVDLNLLIGLTLRAR